MVGLTRQTRQQVVILEVVILEVVILEVVILEVVILEVVKKRGLDRRIGRIDPF